MDQLQTVITNSTQVALPFLKEESAGKIIVTLHEKTKHNVLDINLRYRNKFWLR